MDSHIATSARTTTLILLVFIALMGILRLHRAGRAGMGIDFYQMWVGPRVAREATDFYAPATRARMGELYLQRASTEERSERRLAVARFRRDLEVLSTPLLYLCYAPFRGTYEGNYLAFQWIVIGSLICWFVLYARLYRYGLLFGLFVFAVLVMAFMPVRTDVAVANMNEIMVLLLAIAAAATARSRFFLAGAVLALATLTKPYVILTIPMTWAFLAAARRWRDLVSHAAGAATAGVAGVLVSSLYFRSATIWLDWLREFRAMPRTMISPGKGNIAFAFALREWLGVDVSVPILIVLLGLAIVIAWRAPVHHGHTLLAIGLGCVIFQLGSPLLWEHHLLLSLPLVLYLMRPAEDTELPQNAQRRQVAGSIALVILAIEPWSWLVRNPMHAAVIVAGALILAYGAALWDIAASATSRQRTPHPPSAPSPLCGGEKALDCESSDRNTRPSPRAGLDCESSARNTRPFSPAHGGEGAEGG